MTDMSDLGLDDIGLGRTIRVVLYAVSLLPFVGIVIGGSYAARRNAATRQFGRRLLMYSLALHGFYTVCLCPASLIWVLSR